MNSDASFLIPDSLIQAAAESGEEAGNAVIQHEALIAQSEVGNTPDGNPEGVEVIARWAENAKMKCSVSGLSIAFSSEYPDEQFVDDITSGTNPVLGGDHGVITHPDGTQTEALTKPWSWGKDATEYAINPVMLKENISIQSKALIEGAVTLTFYEGNKDLSNNVMSFLSEKIQNGVGGGT